MSPDASADGRPDLLVQGPGWGPPIDYLRQTLLPRLPGGAHLRPVRNTGRDRPDPPAPHRFEDLVDDLDVAIERIGTERWIVVGHSHGARIAAGHALRRPAGLRAMIWITPVFDESRPGPEGREILAAIARRPGGDATARALVDGPGPAPDDRALARWSRIALPGLFADPDRARDFLAAVRTAAPPSAYAYRSVREDPGPGAESLDSIEIPVLLISGRLDPLAPPGRVEPYAARLRRGRHVVFERSSHHPWFEEPERFERIVDAFLRELLAAADR